MAHEDVLKGIIDGADDEAQGCQDSIDSLNERIAEFQEKQDALKFVMDNAKSELEAEITIEPTIGIFHTYGNYYTGTLNSIDDNINEWQVFNKISTSITRYSDNEFIIDGNYNEAEFTGTGLNTMTYDTTSSNVVSDRLIHYRVEIDGTPGGGNPDTFKWSDRGGISWEETGVEITSTLQSLSEGAKIRFDSINGYTVGDYWDFWYIPTGTKLYFNTSSATSFPESTIISVLFDSTNTTYVTISFPGSDIIPNSLTGLLEYIAEPNGDGWDYDSTSNVMIDMIAEFEFANQYIWTPLGEDGTYGTKANIEALQTGVTIQQNNKDNASESKTKLATYASS